VPAKSKMFLFPDPTKILWHSQLSVILPLALKDMEKSLNVVSSPGKSGAMISL
jgi:hypothetical protein